MKGTLKADKHFVTFAFDTTIFNSDRMKRLIGFEYCKERGYVWVLGFFDDVSYLIEIMPMDEARHMYE